MDQRPRAATFNNISDEREEQRVSRYRNFGEEDIKSLLNNFLEDEEEPAGDKKPRAKLIKEGVLSLDDKPRNYANRKTSLHNPSVRQFKTEIKSPFDCKVSLKTQHQRANLEIGSYKVEKTSSPHNSLEDQMSNSLVNRPIHA